MSSFGVGASTVADQDLYTRARMVSVACGSCGAIVAVKKNSEQHTSIQWNLGGLNACQEFAAAAARPHGRATYEPCPRLMLSIEAAVAAGDIEIGAADGY